MARYIIVVFLIAASFLIAAGVDAAPSWWPLVPCGLNPPEGPRPLPASYYQPCNRCELLHLLKNLVDFVIFGLMPILATLFIVFAGFKILTEGAIPGQVSEARRMFKQTLVGVLFISIAWLLTNTFIRSIAKDNVAQNWWQYQCRVPVSTPIPSDTTQPPTGGLSEANARAQLEDAGIGINANPPQTTLVGIRQSTIDEIVNLKRSCGCLVMVTGGTEPGHSSRHSQGYKIDLRPDPGLNTYITTQFTSLGVTNNGWPRYRSPSGATYTRENQAQANDHWDVDVP